jgi:serine/threonine-protein kinase RsbW
MQILVSMTLPREAVSVPLARRTVGTALRTAGVDRDCVDEVMLSVSEACTNVYHHAQNGDDYEVVIGVRDDELTVDVIDSGHGFAQGNGSAMPDAEAERGRGLALMVALSDGASFDSVDRRGGSVHLMKRLRWSVNAPHTIDG